MKIAICDDESFFAEKLKELVMRTAFENEIETVVFTDGGKLLAYIDVNPVDVIFLDICMDRENGIEVAKKIRARQNRALLVYITSHIDYVQAGYEVRAFRYILKNQLEQELSRLISDLQSELSEQMFSFSYNHETVILNKPDIIYFESDKRLIKVHSISGEYVFYGKLDELEPEFLNFVRCHKSYLIAVKYISSFSYSEIILSDGEIIPISRRYAEQTVAKITRRRSYE